MFEISIFVMWVIIGIINLVFKDNITKIDYLLMFIVLMIQLLKNLVLKE